LVANRQVQRRLALMNCPGMMVTSRYANIAGQFDTTDLLDERFTHDEACFPAKAEENTYVRFEKTHLVRFLGL
jgi:hypothetical protein